MTDCSGGGRNGADLSAVTVVASCDASFGTPFASGKRNARTCPNQTFLSPAGWGVPLLVG
jgi:hypothetical protein